MTKDFDGEYAERLARRDRSFILGGKTYTVAADVHPSTILRYDTMGTPGKDGVSMEKVFDELLEIAPLFVVAGQRDDFGALLRRVSADSELEEVGVIRLQEFVEWATEQVTGRPLASSSDSSAESSTPPPRTDSTPPSSPGESTLNGSGSADSAISSTESRLPT